MRRLLLVVVFTTITDRNWKAMATSILCFGCIFFLLDFNPLTQPSLYVIEYQVSSFRERDFTQSRNSMSFSGRFFLFTRPNSGIFVFSGIAVSVRGSGPCSGRGIGFKTNKVFDLRLEQFGTVAAVANEVALEWVQLTLVISPIVIYLFNAVRGRIADYRKRKKNPVASNGGVFFFFFFLVKLFPAESTPLSILDSGVVAAVGGARGFSCCFACGRNVAEPERDAGRESLQLEQEYTWDGILSRRGALCSNCQFC